MSKFLEFSAKCFLGCGLAVATSASGAQAGAKGHDTVLHSFCTQQDCADGSQPLGGVIADATGNLYGTTQTGGANQSGAVFKLAADGSYSVLYSFCSEANCTDGVAPLSGLIMDSSGDLYGTTQGGGANQAGSVFRLTPDGTETVLYSFCSVRHCRDGQLPEAGLVMDGAGNLYGTTSVGGEKDFGAVFKVSANGDETVLYSFKPGSDGTYPAANLVMDGAGNLYGTTQSGGHGGPGIVFEVSSGGAFSQLYAFCSKTNCADGSNPAAGLLMDGSGNLYGTTQNGGANGYGAVFKLTTNGAETVLYSFCSRGDCSDGAYPASSLIMDGSGNLYGTTQFGNGRDCAENNGDALCGTVFKLAANGAETTLYSFCAKADCTDGSEPAGSLIMDGSGNLYGTTTLGGKGDCIGGCGTVFKLGSGARKE